MCFLGAVITTTTTGSLYGLGSGPVFLANTNCAGTEATLLNCRHTAISIGAYCTHNRDVGVRCEGNIHTWLKYKLLAW